MTLEQKILELWHLSRTALSAQSTVPTRWDRMQYIKKALQEHSPELIKDLSPKKLWFTIDDATNPIK